MQLRLTLKALFVAGTASFLMAGFAIAADQGSAAEAEAMAKKAVAFIKAKGPEKAAEEFTSGKEFKDRDLYISYLDFTGKMLAHGSNPKLVGKDLIELKDPEGKFMVKMAIDVAKNKGNGWTENYKFKNPTTEKLQEKAMYVERVGDSYVGVGIYK
jgi:signal transduction histidine kinase